MVVNLGLKVVILTHVGTFPCEGNSDNLKDVCWLIANWSSLQCKMCKYCQFVWTTYLVGY